MGESAGRGPSIRASTAGTGLTTATGQAYLNIRKVKAAIAA